jgi:teichuronic acid biosynthesis protein TuaF
MNSIFSNIARRAKKLMIILIILPLLAGLVGYVMEKKAPATYTAKATIELGTFQNAGMTNPDKVANMLTYVDNLQKWTKSANSDAIKSHLTIIENPTSDLVHVEYKGTSLTEAKNTLTLILNGFMDKSNALLNKKKEIVNTAADNLQNINIQSPYFDQPKDLVELQQSSLEYDTNPTKIFEKVTASSGYVSPLKRGLFGVIIGLMLDMIILALPEIFRDFR